MALIQHRTKQKVKVVGITVIIFGSCILWQLFFLKQLYFEKERYRISINEDTNQRRQNEFKSIELNNDADLYKSDEDHVTANKAVEYENEEELDLTMEQTLQSDTLLDLSLIRNTLLREAPWAESHGANHLTFLGAGMLYYSMAYSFRSQSIVVLGSGGGFVPRMLRQAQRDLLASGIRPERKDNKKDGRTVNSLPSYDLYLVDAHLAEAGWGSTFYAENENTTMRKQFSDIHYVFELTDDAYTNYFRPMYDDPSSGFKIDYLHIDADHGFEQSWKDFDNYSKLLSDRAVIGFHDTCYDNIERNCHGEGVHETIEKLRSESKKRGLQVIDLHYLYRGIAFAFKENATALETPPDRRINFCVNNADLINVTSEGFTKNGRVGSLPTLGDFMNCSHRYNETELVLAKLKMADDTDPTNGIMAIQCPIQGFRRSVSGKCEKCIPGLGGVNCQRSKYEAVRTQPQRVGVVDNIDNKIDVSDGNDDILHLVGGWLRSLSSKSKFSRPRSMIEIGPNAWKVPKTMGNDVRAFSSPMFFGSLVTPRSSSSSEVGGFKDSDIMVVDPILVTNPTWIDPIVSVRHRFLPCTLKDAIDFDEGEKKKESSKSSSLDIDVVDTFICLACDDLVTLSPFPTTKRFLDSTFPSLRTIIIGMEPNEASNKFVNDLAASTHLGAAALHPGKRKTEFSTTDTAWQLDRDVTMTLIGRNRERKIENTRMRFLLLTRII